MQKFKITTSNGSTRNITTLPDDLGIEGMVISIDGEGIDVGLRLIEGKWDVLVMFPDIDQPAVTPLEELRSHLIQEIEKYENHQN